MIVFEWLKNWFGKNKESLLRRDITFSFSRVKDETDKPSQYVDIDTRTKMARIFLWETGECDFEIIRHNETKASFFENKVIKCEEELGEFLHGCFSKLESH